MIKLGRPKLWSYSNKESHSKFDIKNRGLLNESHPGVFQEIILSLFKAL